MGGETRVVELGGGVEDMVRVGSRSSWTGGWVVTMSRRVMARAFVRVSGVVRVLLGVWVKDKAEIKLFARSMASAGMAVMSGDVGAGRGRSQGRGLGGRG